MQTSINITSQTTSGKKVTKSISNINNSVGNAALTTAASLFTAISNTTYIDADRISKMSLTESYEPTAEKTEPTLSVDSSGNITYNGDGDLYVKNESQYIYIRIYNNTLSAKNEAGNNPTGFSGTIYASEGTNYTAKSANFTVGNP